MNKHRRKSRSWDEICKESSSKKADATESYTRIRPMEIPYIPKKEKKNHAYASATLTHPTPPPPQVYVFSDWARPTSGENAKTQEQVEYPDLLFGLSISQKLIKKLWFLVLANQVVIKNSHVSFILLVYWCFCWVSRCGVWTSDYRVRRFVRDLVLLE